MISRVIEKNWSLFIYDNYIYYDYNNNYTYNIDTVDGFAKVTLFFSF